MKTVRPPAVAGHCYPALPAVLGRGVDILLAHARAATQFRPPAPNALIVPHTETSSPERPLPRATTSCSNLRPALMDRHNTGDTTGDRERVVGFAAVSVTQTATREGQ
jgi:predicted class III extradiol MEMO1 family dioxygenase